MKKALSFFLVVVLLLGISAAAYAQTVVGMLQDAAMHSMVLHTNDNESIGFILGEDFDKTGVLNSQNGLALGQRYLVEAEPDAETPDTLTALSVSALDKVAGKIVKASSDSVQIKTDDGATYTFALDDTVTRCLVSDGLVTGKHLEVVYTDGTLNTEVETQPVRVLELYSEFSATGSIKAVDDNEITLTTASGDYTFALYELAIVNPELAKVGNNATVLYYGKLDDALTQQMVDLVEVKATVPVAEPIEGTITGIFKGETSKTCTVRANGHTYVFKITKATKFRGDAPGVGDMVKITYKGTLDSKKETQSVTFTELRVVKTLEERESKKGNMTGRVVDATMNTVTIKHNKKKYTFSFSEDTVIDVVDGITIGDTLKISYEGIFHSGKQSQSVHVLKIKEK